ncbi:hypothetical protein PFISCL1PPCAC_24499, partial [Pristionchus fissidentatus]
IDNCRMRIPYSRLNSSSSPHRIFFIPICTSRRFFFLITLALLVSFFYFAWSTEESMGGETSLPTKPRFSLDEMRGFARRKSLSTDYKQSYYTKSATSFDRMLMEKSSRFDISDTDVLVFVHIQKTAGTSFEKFLVRHLSIDRPCECTQKRKRCVCKRPGVSNNQTWLFSRYSTGWVCGLHADYTELAVSACVDTVLEKKEGSGTRRRYFYTSFLRDPITRYISEYRHVSRGATWMASRHMCNGRPPTPDEMPLCFDPRIGWEGVTLDEFLSCPFNLASNRMTRMLADLTLVDCYDTTKMEREKRDSIMLESAKANLRSLSFYGLKERMDDSQWMFERLFGLRFTKRLAEWNKSKSNDTIVTPQIMERIRETNALDMELYAYAVELFDERMGRMKREGLPVTVPESTLPSASHFVDDSPSGGDKSGNKVVRAPSNDEDEEEEDDRYEDSERYT